MRTPPQKSSTVMKDCASDFRAAKTIAALLRMTASTSELNRRMMRSRLHQPDTHHDQTKADPTSGEPPDE